MKTIEKKNGDIEIYEVYDDNEQLKSARYFVNNEISLVKKRNPDGTFKEIYWSKGKVINRDKYEKVRKKFPDMPASSQSNDFVGNMMNSLLKVLDESDSAIDGRVDLDINEYNTELEVLINEAMDYKVFIDKRTPCIHTYSSVKTKNIFKKLIELGIAKIGVLDIDETKGEPTFGGELVIELPENTESRTKIFKYLDKLLVDSPFKAIDQGQKFELIKFD